MTRSGGDAHDGVRGDDGVRGVRDVRGARGDGGPAEFVDDSPGGHP